jgi:acyl carrier protein
VTRTEIEQKLIAIIRQEKRDFPEELLKPETVLSEAGIDSLDSLTILFGIEETFGISVSDERARAMKTFGDMIAAIDEQLGSSQSASA